MAQTLPPSPSSSAPLPRYERKRSPTAKAPRPRFQAADALLTALFCALFFATKTVAYKGHSEANLAAFLSALTVGATFLLGWRCGGRLCGIVAGSLIAFSFSFASATPSWETAALTLFSVSALFSFACDAVLIACALAGFAAAARPDGILLGLLLLGVVGLRVRRQMLPNIGAFLVTATIGAALRLILLHVPFAVPAFRTASGAVWLLEPAQTITVWLLIPLIADLTDRARGQRWLPTALWGVISLAVGSLVHFGGAAGNVVPFMPVVFVLAAGGLTRLMPLLAGELPAGRYALATLAIVALLLLRGHAEWMQPATRSIPGMPSIAPLLSSVASPNTPTARLPAAMPVLAPPIHTPILGTPNALQGALAGRTLFEKLAAKPAVPLYTLRDGHPVRRSKWAVQWDLTHPQTKR